MIIQPESANMNDISGTAGPEEAFFPEELKLYGEMTERVLHMPGVSDTGRQFRKDADGILERMNSVIHRSGISESPAEEVLAFFVLLLDAYELTRGLKKSGLKDPAAAAAANSAIGGLAEACYYLIYRETFRMDDREKARKINTAALGQYSKFARKRPADTAGFMEKVLYR